MSKKSAAASDRPQSSPFWSSVKLLLWIVLIAVIPFALRELDLDPDTVRVAGRVMVGLGLALLLYGLVKNIAKLALAVAIALLAFAILVSEGVIDVPRLTG